MYLSKRIFLTRLAVFGAENKSEFKHGCTPEARFENKFVEPELTRYEVRNLHTIPVSHHICITPSGKPFILTDAALENAQWHLSRR